LAGFAELRRLLRLLSGTASAVAVVAEGGWAATGAAAAGAEGLRSARRRHLRPGGARRRGHGRLGFV
ncbi:unnamed protein product, partial [Prorocentrum cordatum]